MTLLHRFLDGDEDAPMPETLWVDAMCQAFGCLPSAAIREAMAHPPGWLEDVLETRRYVEAYHLVKSAKHQADLPSSSTIDLVREIEMAIARAAYDERMKGPNG